MLKWTGKFFIIGKADELKELTCELAWYMSGVGRIASVNRRMDGRLTLNIENSNPDREEYFVREMTELANKYNVTGFQDWNEWRGE